MPTPDSLSIYGTVLPQATYPGSQIQRTLLLSPVVSNHFCPTDLTWGPDYDIHAARSLPTLFLAGGHVASNACSWNLHISRRALGPAPCSGVRHEFLPQFPLSAHHRPPQAALTQNPGWNPILRPPVEHPSSHPTHIPLPLGPLGPLGQM